MEQHKEYIDKSVLVDEIEKKINEEVESSATNFGYSNGCIDSMRNILSFIDTLDVVEVKEGNNLENLFQALPETIADEKSHQVYELSIYHYDGQCVVDYVGQIDHDSLYTFSGNALQEAIEKAWNWLFKNSTGG